jgi:GNAT superfamily N-acetyltransferase
MSEADAREPKGNPGLLTRQLKLRALRLRDMPVLALLAAGDAVRHNLTVVLEPATASSLGETFIVERRKDRAPLGAGGYRATQEDGAAVELALWIGERHWGRGYGTEIAQALIDRAFALRQVNEVCAALRVTNVRGRRLLEKCGFQQRGAGMARAAHGAFPAERFVLSRRTWISLKAWGGHDDDTDREHRRASA